MSNRNENEIKTIYKKMTKPLCAWYRQNARDLPWRKDRIPYHIWLSEIMLQQTRVEAVRLYYIRFLRTLPDIEALANAEEDILLKLWEGLGYYNRIRNMQKAARIIMREHGGMFPTQYRDILALPGIGEYTAGAIVSIAFGAPTPAVDGNVLRVMARLTNDDRCVDTPAFKREVYHRLAEVYPLTEAGEFTQALMELGAIVCLPNGTPKCESCPVQALCCSKQAGTQTDLPVKAVKKARKTEELTVFVFEHNGAIALRRRTQKGVLFGLTELPNVAGTLNEAEAIRTAEQFGLQVDSLQKCIRRKHIFTHIEWHMTCYFLHCRTHSEAFVWASEAELADRHALPTAFRKLLEGTTI